MNIEVKGYTVYGTEVSLTSPLYITYNAYDAGVGNTVYVALKEQPSSSIAYLDLFIDDAKIFSGFIDTIGRNIDKVGDYGFVSATGFFAKMTQSQVYPRTLISISSDDIYNQFAAPFGLKNDLLYTTISKLEITAGMTSWDVIDIFCRQAYSVTPAVRRDGTLSTGGFVRSEVILGEGGIPYTSLKYKEDRTGMFSRVYMQSSDDEHDFSIYTDNSLAVPCGIYRERFYKPPKSWVDFKKRGALEVLRNSNRKRYSYEIEIPQFIDLYPGDVIKIKGLSIDESNFYVLNYKFTYDENGGYSKVILWDLLST